MTSSSLTSSSVFEVLLVEITTPSLLHSRLGTGEPRAAHCRVTFSKMFLTLRMEDGAVVITGGALREKKERNKTVGLSYAKDNVTLGCWLKRARNRRYLPGLYLINSTL